MRHQTEFSGSKLLKISGTRSRKLFTVGDFLYYYLPFSNHFWRCWILYLQGKACSFYNKPYCDWWSVTLLPCAVRFGRKGSWLKIWKKKLERLGMERKELWMWREQTAQILPFLSSNLIVVFWCISQLYFPHKAGRPGGEYGLWHSSDSQQLKISACITFLKNIDFVWGKNEDKISKLTEVMSRVVDAAAPLNLRAAKPRKLKCSFYKVDSFFFFSY